MVEKLIMDYKEMIFEKDATKTDRLFKMLLEEPEIFVLIITTIISEMIGFCLLYKEMEMEYFVLVGILLVTILVVGKGSDYCRKKENLENQYKSNCLYADKLRVLLRNEYNILSKENVKELFVEVRDVRKNATFKHIWVTTTTAYPIVASVYGWVYKHVTVDKVKVGMIIFAILFTLLLVIIFLFIAIYKTGSKKARSLHSLQESLFILITMEEIV